jgi:hypothetical protein
MELDRLQARLDVLYDDRLDGRIDATTYDKKAEVIRWESAARPNKNNSMPASWIGSCKRSRRSDVTDQQSSRAVRAPMRERTASAASACFA